MNKSKRASSIKAGDRLVMAYYGPGEVAEVELRGTAFDIRFRPDDRARLADTNTTGTVTFCNVQPGERFDLAGKAVADA